MKNLPNRPYSPQHEAGYLDGKAGRPPADDAPNYREGHAAGSRAAKRKAAS
jgi:hypothetical protein